MKSEKGKTKSEKVRTSILFTFSLLLFTSAATAETVGYWDPVGKVTNSVEAVVVTGATTTLTGGWYVVTGEVSRAQINVTGTEARPANLILADGAKLTARDSSDYHPGIKVASGAALNIYAQSVDADTMGQLSAYGGYGGAGIGGAGEGGTCGTVNIYGGKLTAVGGEYAAGIGGGGKASKTGGTGGTISIYGGIVTANGVNGGAAIGGGNRADGGTISIYGGEVIADNTKGDSEGAGIGGGYDGSGGMILIAGGKVTAVGGYKDDGGAGIGGGEEGSGGTIMITGGIVNATGTDYGAGIGGGDEGAGGDVTISGGTVVAKAGKSSVWDIGSGDTGGSSGEFVVTGGSVLLANSMKCRDGYPKNGDGTQVYGVMVSDFEANAAVKIEGLPNYGTNDIFADASGNVYLYLPKGSHSFTANGEARSVTVVYATKTKIAYWDPVSRTEKSALCIEVGDSTVLEDGNWYVVNGKVERGSVAVNGKANLILADGCELKANGYSAQAGIAVSEGNSLTIYAQAGGMGKLTANGAYYGAGIGGGQYCSCGTVTINGGVVTATGGSGGAGIGGGSSDYYRTQPRGNGGLVTINGGTVTANGGWHGAGIGGGSYSAGGQATITGGRLTVTSEEGDIKGDLIGAGAGGHSRGTIAISGGIFSWRPDDAWLVDLKKVMVCKNPDAKTSVSYPWAVLPLICVSFERPLEHMDIGIVYTSDGEPVADVILRETHFLVPKGTSGVKVVFTSKGCYEIDKTEYAFTGPINEDCTIPAEDLPTVKLVWPEGYKRVEYIGSTAGGGQYIDTGIKSSPTLRATMDYRAFEHTGRVNLGTFGADDADWRYFDHSGGPLFDCGSARVGSTSENTLDLNVRYVVNVGTDEDDIYLTVTDAARQAEVKSFTAKRNGTPSAENVFVFGGCSGDSVVCTPMRLYSLTLRDFVDVGSRPFMSVTDFVPCVRTSDGTAGLYDLMGNRFVENAGEGSFVLEEDEPLAIVTVPRHEHVVAFWTSGDESETNRIEGSTFWVAKGAPFKVMFTPEYNAYALEGPLAYESDGVLGDVGLTDEQVPVALVAPVEYVDADGLVKSRAIGEYVLVTNKISSFSSGWYALGGNISCGPITVNGDVHLILMNGCKVTATGGDNQSGVAVSSGKSLTIYGQMAGTGKLTAMGGYNGAGIGGGKEAEYGTVTINGGTVTAQGGHAGAGIGSGWWGYGGMVTINGGTVTALGGEHSAGIGGGYGGKGTNGGTVTINGGEVTATGGDAGAGIGGGSHRTSGGTVTINGGEVTATSGEWGAGIGGGYEGAGGTIMITGGIVNATGTDYGAGIGGGYEGACGAVTISGGQLNVRAGEEASTIGAGGNGDSQGTVAISGGIFAWKPNDAWLVLGYESVSNTDEATREAYPWAAVKTGACVTFGRTLEHMTAAWTSGDGSVTNAIRGTSFAVPKGTSGVKVVFASKGSYEIDKTEYTFAGPINEDCTIPAEDLPTAQFVWPEGYRQVEYIESTVGGGQYIDTGVKASSTLTATMDYMAFEHTGQVNLGTLGDDNADWRYFDYSGGPLFDCGSARAGSTSGNTLDLNVRYVVNVGTDEDDIYLTVTDAARQTEVKSFTAKRYGTPSAENVFVFGGYSGDSVVCTPMRLYSLTLRDFVDDGDAVRTILAEFVPCVRTSDGAVGLYDIENGVFKENAGSGVFVLLEDYPTCEGGTIGFVNGVWVITPTNGAPSVTIANLPEGAKLAVKCGEYAVPSAAFVGFGEGKTEGVFSLALDENGVVTIGGEEIPVKPTIGDLDEGEPFVVGEGEVALTIKTIAGLKYSLVRGTEIGAIAETVVEPTIATDAEMTLKDDNPPTDKAFYRVDVRK